jgi:hypothetical protein
MPTNHRRDTAAIHRLPQLGQILRWRNFIILGSSNHSPFCVTTSFHKQPASFPFHLKSLSLGSAVASGPAEVARTMCADFHLRQTHFNNYRSSSVFKLVRLSVSQMA